MRRLLNWLALFVLFIVIPGTVKAQQIKQTAKQAVYLQEIANLKKVTQTANLEKVDNSYLAYFQFNRIPDDHQLEKLKQNGLRLISYKDKRTYLVAFPKNLTEGDLRELGIVAFAPTQKKDKLSSTIQEKDYPGHSIVGINQLKVAINFYAGYPKSRYKAILDKYEIEVLEDRFRSGCSMTAIVDPVKIEEIADEPLISFIDVVTPPVEVLNNEVRVLQKISYVNSTNGKNLNGSGVVIGIGDGGELGDHLDFQNRVINYANGTYSSFGDHGDHVAGIIGGAGILNPNNRGIASQANLLIQKTSLVTYYMEDYYNDDGMVLTNNSYGTSFNCSSNGTYNYTSQNLDWQMREFPEVLHVFAAGNSGSQSCSPYPTGYFTLLRYYQSAKNILTVGNVTDTRVIKSNSSRGPASDGRLKPEICGVGTSVTSTGRNYDYTTKSGTSMASPAVTGTLALLYESYKNANNGANPKGGLIKAIACNTADDLGNVGPDYTYGFGLINGLRAIETIEDGRFIEDAVSDGQSETHNITIPSGTKQVKVMLYWQDKEADPYPVKALVNDLDLVLTTSTGSNYLPWVLNFDPAHVEDVATRQVDNLNNIEQVTIDNPTAGTYTITVNGSEVPYGPQSYFIVYEFVSEDVVITSPVGGEQFASSDVEVIQWDTDPTNTSSFTVDYTLDDGNTWITIDNNVPATERSVFWTVPNNFSENGHVRVTKNTGNVNDSNSTAFSIFEMPALTTSPACEGRILLEWPALNGADYYEIMMFDGTDMVLIDTTTNLEFLLEDSNLVIGDSYWFSMRGRTDNGGYSKRADTQSCIPQMDVLCPWNNDVVADAIKIPLKGRIKTNTEYDVSEKIMVDLKNIGTNTVAGLEVSFQINEDSIITEIYSDSLASGETVTYTFNQTYDMSSVGLYEINTWVNFPDDLYNQNDSLIGTHISEQLDNEEVSLESGPVIFDFDLDNAYTYMSNQIGLTELANWDFETTVEGTLVAGSSNGIELLISDNVDSIPSNYSNSALFTLNLENYDPNNGLFLDFMYSNNNLFPLDEEEELLNKVDVRGSDTDVWLEVYLMDETETGWHTVRDINLLTVLNNAGQSLSSSFQIRFEEKGEGLLIDNFALHQTGSLPVELIAFSATKQGEDALIKWRTASEFNNEYFEVQVATSAQDAMDGLFTTLAQVPGLGTSIEETNYSYVDDSPDKSGFRFYRLKQVDFDGKFSFSIVRQVEFPTLGLQVNIYPNPFAKYIIINSEKSTLDNLNVKLFNGFGKMLESFEIPSSNEPWSFRFDLKESYPSGMYFLRFDANDRYTTIPLTRIDEN